MEQSISVVQTQKSALGSNLVSLAEEPLTDNLARNLLGCAVLVLLGTLAVVLKRQPGKKQTDEMLFTKKVFI
jgi:hypothetical protein